MDHYNVLSMDLAGCVLFIEKWCSPQFAKEVLRGRLPDKPGKQPIRRYWWARASQVFRKLEDIYAFRLWKALLRAAASGRRELYFNFQYQDFCRTGIDKPSKVCELFINELTLDISTCCYATGGKFYGIHYDVWGNGAFTTHFTW